MSLHVHQPSILLLYIILKVVLYFFATVQPALFLFRANHQPYSKFWVAMAHLIIPDILIYIFERFLEPFAPYLGYSDLSACCLVCKQWQTFAQTVLFRHAFLAHSQQLASFLTALSVWLRLCRVRFVCATSRFRCGDWHGWIVVSRRSLRDEVSRSERKSLSFGS